MVQSVKQGVGRNVKQASEQGSKWGLERFTAFLLILEGFLVFVPVVVLGAAINWPASLDEPASVNFPLLTENWDMVLLGYGVYLIYSILFWPLSHLVTRVVTPGDVNTPLLSVASGFGVASAVLRVLGIIRWLYPMPMLAQLYLAPDVSEQTQETISIVYETLNAYAGNIGEMLGVSLFAAMWFTLVSIALLRSANFPKWLGVYGLVSAFTLYTPLVSVAGVDPGLLIPVSVTVSHVWFWAFAGVLLVRKARS
ncbi:MAG: DUF4386 family protein [Deinococcota bacterium]